MLFPPSYYGEHPDYWGEEPPEDDEEDVEMTESADITT